MKKSKQTKRIDPSDSDKDIKIKTKIIESTESENISYDTQTLESQDIESIIPSKFFDQKELLYYKQFDNFFKNCSSEKIDKMISIIQGESEQKISLRILDWFVTKYTKKHDVVIGKIGNKINLDKDSDVFDIRINYRTQLKSYKKHYFDPFRRRKKFKYYFHNGKYINTTLGQLNFFRWAFTHDILNYVESNLELIVGEMNSKEEKMNKRKKKTKNNDIENNKIIEGSINIKAEKKINKQDDELQIILNFD